MSTDRPLLAGKHCLVTGAAQGIGGRFAERFAAAGANVIAAGEENSERNA